MALLIAVVHFILVAAVVFLGSGIYVPDTPNTAFFFLFRITDILLQPLSLVFHPDADFPMNVALVAVALNSLLWGAAIALLVAWAVRVKVKRAAF